MDDRVLDLFEDFAAARARGERPDPGPYLDRADDDAGRLGALIEALVTSAPPPPAAPEVVAMMDALVRGEPPLLGARLHRRLAVDAVVVALVDALGLDPARRAKVKRLYQRLEGGLLDPARVDPRLAAVLARTLGIRPRDIALGRPAAPAQEAGMLYARTADAMPDLDPAALASPAATPEPDEIDRLFGLG